MLNKIKDNIFLIIILIIGIFLAAKNYTPGTFLSGWDSLHPEFNFDLALQRGVNGVFREEQGLGAIAVHSHMADLPRVVILYLLHFIFPQDSLRYLYIFLNLILGPIGIYIFLNKHVVKNKIASFLGALFYLLNLGTMQLFVVPFEMFTTQYATLPWLFLFATDYLYSKKKSINKLLLFSTATLLATPMAYAATLWYVYFVAFFLHIVSLNIFTRFLIVKKSVVLILLTIFINSFWILPNIYFVLNHSQEVANALINQLFSPQAFLYNKEFGNIKDIVLLKNFLFDWSVYAGNDNFAPLLLPWVSHLNQMPVKIVGYLFAFISFAGVLHTVVKRNKLLVSFLPVLFLCLFFLINDNPPTSFLYNFLEDKVPLFKEAFRFPGDKVLGIFIFVFTIYFAKGQEIILKKLNKGIFIYLSICLFTIFYYMLPVFKGNLISPFMRISIPKSYFEMFDWLKEQDPSARIANLPIHSVWGWKYYDWHNNKPSFQGADFLQFGIKQSLLDRDFDRWNPNNEQYYREMSQAVYSQDQIKLSYVLQKYNISYIVLDRSIISPEQGRKSNVLFFDETQALLEKIPDITRVFEKEHLFVYQKGNRNKTVSILINPVSVGPFASAFYHDFTYFKYRDYITYFDPDKNDVLFPNRNLVDNQSRLNQKNFYFNPVSPEVLTDVRQIDRITNDCPADTTNKPKKDILREFVKYTSEEGSFCDHYSYPTLSRNQGYLISVVSKNIQGLPLRLCLTNYLSRRCDIYTQLSSFSMFGEDIFLLPPMGKSVGFDINFDNFGIKGTPSVNELKSIEIMPLNYAELSQIETYNVSAQNQNKSVLVYSQSFDSGWKAYQTNFQFSILNFQLENAFPFLFGKELKEHVLVNNWANGWILNNSQLSTLNSQLVIIFWPQYLEYLGFAILIVTFAWLIIRLRKT